MIPVVVGSNPISHPITPQSVAARIETIQVLRGGAAVMVVLWHGSRYTSPYGEGLGTALFGGGNSLGVDIFFVVSGFIMVHRTWRLTAPRHTPSPA